MEQTFAFLKRVLDSLDEHIAVLDRAGDIQFTNRAWRAFCQDNCAVPVADWRGVNYLAACDKAAAAGDETGGQAAEGIRRVIQGETLYQLEYPCHSPDEKRWFMMRVTRFDYAAQPYFVVAHLNITERKLAEERLVALSRRDGLTGLPNRRFFDEFYHDEWRRCARLGLPITVAMVDIDHFKLLNDTYGHQYGDEALVRIAGVISEQAKRPSDLCARFGGEEFVLVFGNSTALQLQDMANDLLARVRELRIFNERSPTHPCVTVSMGMATRVPDGKGDERELLNAADMLLYAAKAGGRDRVAWSGTE